MMVSKGINILSQTEIFNDNIRGVAMSSHRPEDMGKFSIFFHQYRHEQRKAVTTTGKGGYTMAVQNIHGIPSIPIEEHHEAIDHISPIVQGMQMQIHDLEVLVKFNAVLTRSNMAVMAQLVQMTVTMNAMQAQLKTLAAAPMKQTRLKRKYYCWSFGRNYTHRSKTLSSNKSGHQDEAYYKKRLGGREKWCDLWLGAEMNKFY